MVRFICTAIFLIFSQAAWCLELAGVKFPETVAVAGQGLVLNGAGIRIRAIFKVYVMALYLPSKESDPNTVLAQNSAKKLHAVMLREVDGDALGRLLMQGIRDNNSPQETSKHLSSIIKMGQAFSERKKILAGESFGIDFDPQKGALLKVNGKVLGEPLGDPSFNAVLLRVWLGKDPADLWLKDALLGIPAKAPNSN